MKKLLYISLSTALLAGCASAPPPDNDPARARAKQGYADLNQEAANYPKSSASAETAVAEPVAAPSIQVSNATFKTTPTVLVSPAISGKMAGSIDVIRRNP